MKPRELIEIAARLKIPSVELISVGQVFIPLRDKATSLAEAMQICDV